MYDTLWAPAWAPWIWFGLTLLSVSYLINWWLVKHRLKHGMGMERALGKGEAPLTTAQ